MKKKIIIIIIASIVVLSGILGAIKIYEKIIHKQLVQEESYKLAVTFIETSDEIEREIGDIFEISLQYGKVQQVTKGGYIEGTAQYQYKVNQRWTINLILKTNENGTWDVIEWSVK